MTIDFIADDIIHWANTYHGPKFHALLCDPPYHLSSMYRAPTPHAISINRKFPQRRMQSGFMGKEWDGGDIAFRPDAWAALAEHLLPGAFLMAFGGSRTYHRMACAIEDAGLVIHPAVVWVQGQGFPKSTSISNQIDKKAGVKGEVIRPRTYELRNDGGYSGGLNTTKPRSESCEIVAPATPLAQTWAGHRYGLQSLKPAAEFICVAQKPYDGKPVESIVESGAGALNIEASRIGLTDYDREEYIPNRCGWKDGIEYKQKPGKSNWFTSTDNETQVINPSGRWPANLILDSDAARVLDEMSGERRVAPHGPNSGAGIWGSTAPGYDSRCYPDSGGVSRFFFTYSAEALDDADPFFYCAKASRSERDSGLDGMPLKHLAERPGRDNCMNSKRDLRYDDRPAAITSPAHNPHPTVKPLALCRYLATLLLPPAEYAPRRLLIPFAGVMSEAIGAMQAGWDEITAIEREAEYVEIGRARAEYWRKQVAQLKLPV